MKETLDSPIKRQVVDHFDSLAVERWDREYQKNSFIARKAGVKALLSSVSRGTVLDLGCGTGQFTEIFAQRGDRYFGVDASNAMIEVSKRRAKGLDSLGFQSNFEVQDAEELSFPDAYFDIIIAAGLIEYFKSYDRLMREINRVVKPGGTIIITVPKAWSTDRLVYKALAIPRLLLRPLYYSLSGKRPEKVYRKMWTPHRLEKVCRLYALQPIDGLHYGIKLLGFPFNRILPNSADQLNSHFEQYSQGIWSVFTNGYIIKATKVRAL